MFPGNSSGAGSSGGSNPPPRRDGGRPNDDPDFFAQIFGSSAPFQNINLSSLLNLGPLPPRVHTHIRNVFLTLFGMTLLFTFGILLRLNVPVNLALSGAAAFASFIALNWMQRTRENLTTRMGLLAVTAVTTGISMGDLVGYSLQLNPTIVLQAALASVLAFGSFALSALTSPRRSWLFLGGGLMSFLSVTALFQIFASLFGRGLDIFAIYVGLAGLLGFILFDTQVMVERAATQKGFLDPVYDSQQLFIDLVGVFRRLLILLNQREVERRRREEEDKRKKRRN